jgi:hypothetical protein
MFETNKDDRIDFHALAYCLSKLYRGTREEKLESLINLFIYLNYLIYLYQ